MMAFVLPHPKTRRVLVLMMEAPRVLPILRLTTRKVNSLNKFATKLEATQYYCISSYDPFLLQINVSNTDLSNSSTESNYQSKL